MAEPWTGPAAPASDVAEPSHCARCAIHRTIKSVFGLYAAISGAAEHRVHPRAGRRSAIITRSFYSLLSGTKMYVATGRPRGHRLRPRSDHHHRQNTKGPEQGPSSGRHRSSRRRNEVDDAAAAEYHSVYQVLCVEGAPQY